MDFTEKTKNLLVKFWQKSWQNKLVIIVIGLFILFTISRVLSPQGQMPISSPTLKPTVTPTPVSSLTPKKISYEPTKLYYTGDEKWQSVIITPGATKDEVLLLAKELHKNNPDIHYNIFDDNKELQAYIKWETSQNDPAVYYPEAWDKQHYIGMINQMLTTEGMKWQFTSDSEKYLGIVNLE